jgi:putative endonuclease
MKSWFVYILECADGTLYTGVTDDLVARVKAHNEGRGAKYTKGRGPVKLRFTEKVTGRGEAQKREAEIKRLSRREKLSLW